MGRETNSIPGYQVNVWINDLALASDGRIYSASNLYQSIYPTNHLYWQGFLSSWAVAGFFGRTVPSGSWTQYPYPPAPTLEENSYAFLQAPNALAGDGNGNLYGISGDFDSNYDTDAGSRLTYYNVSSNTWALKANPSSSRSSIWSGPTARSMPWDTPPTPRPRIAGRRRLLRRSSPMARVRRRGFPGPGTVGSHRWTLNVSELAAMASTHVTVTAQTGSAVALSGLTAVTSTVQLWAGGGSLPGETVATISYRVDSQAPTVYIDMRPGATIGAGTYTFSGLASDGNGSGLARVEIRQQGTGAWIQAVGTLAWSAALTIPSGATEFTLEARAVDTCGETSMATQTFSMDITAPQLSWMVPGVVTATVAVLSGSTSDPAPAAPWCGRYKCNRIMRRALGS
jgi:hypothetical protein